MAAPIKRIPDTLLPGSEPTRNDLDPHVAALPSGGFTIGFDDQVSATDTNANGDLFRADGAFVSVLNASDSPTSNETAQSRYGLADGNVVMVWLMQDGLRTGGDVLGNLTGYTAIGAGDFNQDGNTDILWQNNTSGVVDLWLMGGGHMMADINLGNLTGYSLLGVGDFNGDHTSDLVWRNNMSGVTETWQMQLGVRTGGVTLGNLAGYQLIDTGDLNHDGTDDMLWKASTGVTTSWAMRDGQFRNDEQFVATVNPATFTIGGFGDFTGDGGKDVLLLNPGSNQTLILDIEHHSLVTSDFLIS